MTCLTRAFPTILLTLLPACVNAAPAQSDPDPLQGQPSEERQAQAKLPQSNNPLWATLAQARVNYNKDTDELTIVTPPEVKALDHTVVQGSGFVLPLDGNDKTKHFLLTKRTPVCLYCPPGAPNEVIEVWSKTPLTWTTAMVTFTGKFKLINDGERAMFFEIDDAVRVR